MIWHSYTARAEREKWHLLPPRGLSSVRQRYKDSREARYLFSRNFTRKSTQQVLLISVWLELWYMARDVGKCHFFRGYIVTPN